MFAGNCPVKTDISLSPTMLAFMKNRLGLNKLAVVLVEKGHTETENESVHSVIERATITTEMYTPEHWYAAFQRRQEMQDSLHSAADVCDRVHRLQRDDENSEKHVCRC